MRYDRTLWQKLFDTVMKITPDVLNTTGTKAAQPDSESPDVLLKKLAARIKVEAINTTSGTVDYTRFKDSEVYREYRRMTALLPGFDLQTLVGREQKLAFWLNLYNALVMDGIIHYGVRDTVNEVPGFFSRAAYNIGGYRFSLDDIEHGILRANAGHPVIPGPQFGRHDSRLQFALEKLDMRIHFALVCGAASCPPINFYDAEAIDTQLDLAAKNFLNQTVIVDPTQEMVELSKILQWYGADFGAGRWVKLGIGDKTPLLRAVRPFILHDETRAFLDAVPRQVTIRFRPYNWSLNTVQVI
ncbi:MAG: DUF547 domain-containing protein [Anaerolineae bacterium]|nr:DUF547 domain-containing protein [Anaerolineae bacterium]